MELTESKARVGLEAPTTGWLSSSVLIAFSLVAAFAYRVSVSVVPPGLAEDGFILLLGAVLLALALGARRSTRFNRYWQIPYAFFVFTLAGFLGDGTISP